MAIASARYVYVGAHVTERTKETLRQEAGVKGCSMSLLVSLAITEYLERQGHDLSSESVIATTSDVT